MVSMIAIILIFMMIYMSLAQDDNFTSDPIHLSSDASSRILPVVLNPGGMIKAIQPSDLSIQNDAWMINALAWLGNNSSNSSLFYA